MNIELIEEPKEKPEIRLKEVSEEDKRRISR